MKTPSLLSYNRSIHPTDAVFFADLGHGKREPIPVLCKTTLGTESQFDKTGQSKPTGNPQRVEFAALPFEYDTLGIEFHLTVTGSALKPMSCNVPEWRKAAIAMADAYKQHKGFEHLGTLYAANIANGRWAWKNRLFASEFITTVTIGDDVMSFQSLDFSLDDITSTAGNPDVQRLGSIIAAGLAGEHLVRMVITGRLVVGAGATVFPSQEFSAKDDADDAIGKILFATPYKGLERCAAFHEQKIGAAIRTIDIFHGGFDGVPPKTPLPVNPYAQDREAYVVVRSSGSGNADFYTLMKKGIEKFPKEEQVSDDFHFVMANLVRGGVFGYGSNKPTTEEQGAA